VRSQVSRLEGPESIEIVDIPEPVALPGEVVIDVHAAGGHVLAVGFTGGEIPTVKVNRLLLKNVEVVVTLR
jgi:NADPH:quinone reductase-like Zn-dependent oxidoreductase